jgi:hypothetical protein
VKDLHGLTISTSSAEAAAAMERALSSFLKFRLDAREHLSRCLAADPEFGLAHCFKGYFAMLLYKQAGVAPAAQSARTARALAAKATTREQSHVEALEAWRRPRPYARGLGNDPRRPSDRRVGAATRALEIFLAGTAPRHGCVRRARCSAMGPRLAGLGCGAFLPLLCP